MIYDCHEFLLCLCQNYLISRIRIELFNARRRGMLCLYVQFFRHRQSAARKYQDKEADIIMAQVKVIHTCPGLWFPYFRYHMTLLTSFSRTNTCTELHSLHPLNNIRSLIHTKVSMHQDNKEPNTNPHNIPSPQPHKQSDKYSPPPK